MGRSRFISSSLDGNVLQGKILSFRLDPTCPSFSGTWIWTGQNQVWFCGTLSAFNEQLEGAGESDRRRMDDEMGRQKRLRKDVETLIGREVRPVLPGCQYGMDVGPHQGPHHATRHIRGGLSKFCESVR